ncbi:MAG: type II toxin-antitoxin system YafQ family toxin [Methyloglobulus sp.]|nr:type II toxin-antitoxin system YafQ family toxin [Methyloglobulus sp.]
MHYHGDWVRTAKYTNRFNREVKLSEKRGENMDKLRHVISLLLANQPLPRELADRPLVGEWKLSRGLHIEHDWVLFYSVDDQVVCFQRIGSYADLFGSR